MLKIGEAMKKGAGVFVENNSIYIVYSLAWAIFIGSALFVGTLWGISFVVIFLVVLPIQTSLSYISKVAGDHKEVTNNDFYFGFKMMLPSLVLQSKMVMKGFIIGFLTFILVLFLGAVVVSYIIQVLEPALFNMLVDSIDVNAAYDVLISIPWFTTALFVTIIASAIAAILSYVAVGSPSNFAPYISFETPFNQDAAVALSKKIIYPKRKSFFLFNLLFLSFFIPVAILGGAMYYLLISYTTLNILVIQFVTILLIALCFAPINLYHHTCNYQLYALNFQAEIKSIYNEYIEISQRRNEQHSGNQPNDETPPSDHDENLPM